MISGVAQRRVAMQTARRGGPHNNSGRTAEEGHCVAGCTTYMPFYNVIKGTQQSSLLWMVDASAPRISLVKIFATGCRLSCSCSACEETKRKATPEPTSYHEPARQISDYHQTVIIPFRTKPLLGQFRRGSY